MRNLFTFKKSLLFSTSPKHVPFRFTGRVEQNSTHGITLEIDIDGMERSELHNFGACFVRNKMIECIAENIAINAGISNHSFEVCVDWRIELHITEEFSDDFFGGVI